SRRAGGVGSDRRRGRRRGVRLHPPAHRIAPRRAPPWRGNRLRTTCWRGRSPAGSRRASCRARDRGTDTRRGRVIAARHRPRYPAPSVGEVQRSWVSVGSSNLLSMRDWSAWNSVSNFGSLALSTAWSTVTEATPVAVQRSGLKVLLAHAATWNSHTPFTVP